MKIKALTLAILATTFYMMSCSATKSTTESTTSKIVLTDDHEVEKTLKMGEINGIRSELVVEIHYTQGSNPSVKVRTTQKTLERTDLSMNGSTLVIKQKHNTEEDFCMDKITFYITSPKLNSLNNSGHMEFISDQMRTNNLQINNSGICSIEMNGTHDKGDNGLSIDNSGRLTVKVPTIDTKLLSLDNTGILTLENNDITGGLSLDNSGRLDFSGNIKGQGAEVYNDGICSMTSTLSLTGSYSCNNKGRLEMKGNVKGTTAELYNSGICTMTSALDLTDSYSCDNKGRLEMTGDVKGTTADLYNSGVCKMNGSFTLQGDYSYKNAGRADNNGDVTARTITISNSGMDNRTGSLKADKLSMSVNGRSEYDMSFNGGNAKLNCSGIGQFKLALNCQSLNVYSSGRINVVLSGTADKTSFDGTGVSNVNTSRLNKF